jgi:hypothetical protein
MMKECPPRSDESVVQPRGSQTVADPKGQGITLIVPPLGFRRAPKTPFVFAVLWLGGIALFTLQTATALSGPMPRMDSGVWVGLAAFLGVFWLAGLLLAAGAIQGACTRTVLTLGGGFFLLTLEGPFRTRRRRWLCSDVQGFAIERFNLPANRGGPGSPHLRIQLRHWRRGIGILAGRDQRELRWVTALLSQALEKAARQARQLSPDVPEQPASSGATLERGSAGLMLKLPAPGFRRPILFATVGGLLAGGALIAGAWALANAADWPWALPLWFGFGVTVGLGLLAFGVTLEAVGYAFRREELTANEHVLSASHATWWGGVRATEWRRSKIACIDVDIGTNPLPRLRVHLIGGRTQQLLIYRDEDELLWIATHLRRMLQVPCLEEGRR